MSCYLNHWLNKSNKKIDGGSIRFCFSSESLIGRLIFLFKIASWESLNRLVSFNLLRQPTEDNKNERCHHSKQVPTHSSITHTNWPFLHKTYRSLITGVQLLNSIKLKWQNKGKTRIKWFKRTLLAQKHYLK